MFCSNARLRDFTLSVPVCDGTVSLSAALVSLNQAGRDCLVLVDDTQQSFGLIRLSRLLPFLAECLGRSPSGSMSTPNTSHETGTALLQLDPTVMEPLTLVSEALSIDQWLSQLPMEPPSHYAIIGENGTFQGLIDTSRLLADLFTHLPSLALEGTELSTKPSPLWTDQEPQPQEPSPQLRALPSHIDPLLEVLECLPLPLMVQTEDGRVVVQNPAWCKQFSELLDPGWVKQEVALCLTPPEAALAESSPLAAPLQTALAWEYATEEKAEGRSPDPKVAQQRPSRHRSETLTGAMSALPFMPGMCQVGSQPNTCICTCPLKNGQEQILQFVKIPLGMAALQTAPDLEKPPVMLWLIMAQDMTQQQQLARELTAKNADLVQLNRLKDEFLACISHELRTPLTAILGLSSLLKDQTLGNLNQRQVHYAQLIHQSGRHLMTIVNDILDLTRMETGQLELSLEPVPIANISQRAFEQSKQLRQLENKHVASFVNEAAATADPTAEFSLSIEPGLEFLIADEQRLCQMLMHLLSNALKFTEPEGQIGLKVNRWGGWIAFTIWDTGIGIPAAKQHLIFQKFQQLENPLTRRFEGTGLGLVLTQRLARLHGGDVTFTSKEGRGSQFTILLPPTPPGQAPLVSEPTDRPWLATNDATLPAIAVQSTNPLSGHSALSSGTTQNAHSQLVLIVEAQTTQVDHLAESLTVLGYRIVIARSGTDALEKARRLQPCVIFLNPLLPLLSGWDVLTLLKSNPQTRFIPVVVTAVSNVDQEQASRNHADGFLAVPVSAKPLQQVLKKLVAEPTQTAARDRPSGNTPMGKKLTILHLSCGDLWHPSPTTPINNLNLLQAHQYRILQADDLEQAELLARVWKPDLVLLDGDASNWTAYFNHFSQFPVLVSLPLVTVNATAAQAANQVAGLVVFPCLIDATTLHRSRQDLHPALLQVIQIAAGYAWRPTILALDVATLVHTTAIAESEPNAAFDEDGQAFPNESEWLQALLQYLQMAGYRGLPRHDWQSALEQLRSRSVDLLLLCWTDGDLAPEALTMLSTLQQLPAKPPILVLDHRNHRHRTDVPAIADLPAPLRQIATQILPSSLSMIDLLEHIHQAIKL